VGAAIGLSRPRVARRYVRAIYCTVDYISHILNTSHAVTKCELQQGSIWPLISKPFNQIYNRDLMLVVTYILVINIYFIPTECTILKVLAQHVADVTAPIIRSTTVVYFTFSAIGFGFWCVYFVRLVMVFGHMVTISRSVLDSRV
jgi:hypothetical protein